jgi:LuxR family maltose regulon positive regulatory protein
MPLDATTHLVMMLCRHGQLKPAGEFVQQGLQFVEQFGLSNSTEASMLYLAWGYILCEQHDLEEAGKFIRRGLEICQQANIPGMVAWAYQINIRYLLARGDFPAAEDAAREAGRLAKEVEIPAGIEQGISTLRVQVWIRQGKLVEAETYLQERRMTLKADLEQVGQSENTVLGRLMLARGDLDRAECLLGDLRQRGAGMNHQRQMIYDQIYLALLYEARESRQKAVQALNRALALAEPEGYIQVFLDEGEALAALLDRAARQGDHKAFARRLTTLMTTPLGHQRMGRGHRLTNHPPEYIGDRSGLSQREQEVLRLMADGLSNKEIAQRLYISLRTVKYHTTNIFTKLNVANRTQAAARAKAELLL